MPRHGPLTNAEVSDDVEILEADTPFQGYFRIDRYRLRHRRHDGGWTGEIRREVFERGHAAAVVPYDPVRDEVVLIEQFRIGALAAGKAAWQVEIVAGIVEPGETPEDVARREAREESGQELRELIKLYHYLVSPGGTSETAHIYCGIVDSTHAGGIHGLDAEEEDIRVFAVPFKTAWAMVTQGRIDNAPTLIALQWLALNRAALRARFAPG
jgi:ADP-ribose pyrophosphatase